MKRRNVEETLFKMLMMGSTLIVLGPVDSVHNIRNRMT